jgi:hypothetical protein
MKAHELVAKALKAVGVPFALQAFPTGGAPDPPFAVYTVDGYGETYADDEVVLAAPTIEVGLYEREIDVSLEMKVYEALTEAFGPVKRDEAWMESEHARVVWFDFQCPPE